METVQQTVVHLDHGGMPPQAQMAYAQRSATLQRASQQDGPTPYKPARQAQLSPSSRQSPYAAYPATRFVQQPGYAVPFRDSIYSVRTPQPERAPPPSQPPQAPPPQPAQQPAPPPSQQQPPQPPPPSQQQQQSLPQAQLEYLREAPPTQLRNRISLLPSSEFLNQLQPRGARLQPPDQCREAMPLVASGPTVHYDVGPPYKRLRLGETKPDVQQPLRIDTREQQAYNPQVEAISPTLPTDSLQEDASYRSTKDELLQQIGKVDREIAKAESQILKLKKKQLELEEAANKPNCKKEEEEIAQPKHQSPAQKIYAENRKKAQEAHSLLEKLGPKVDLPLYNQPSDTAVYHENKIRHQTLKRRLVEHFRRQHVDREGREKFLTATYSKLMQEWLRKVEKVESSQKRKAKESKNREFFEKVFPELRKQREDRERFNRVGARIKSEADLEEIMDGLQEQEMEDKKMRSYAVIPPILLDARQRKISYANNNGRIEDFTAEYKERQLLNVWTTAEREVFKEKYLQHPKNFGVIASYLERKSVCDCVQYYYLSKKTENYKQLLRKSRQRTRASRNNPHGKPGAAGTGAGAQGSTLADVLAGPTGVTTRLQREQQQQKQEMVAPQSSPAPTPPPAPAPSSSPAPPQAAPPPPPSGPLPTEVKERLLTPPPSVEKEVTPPAPEKEKTNIDNNKVENKKKERRKEDKKKKDDLETSDEECPDSQEKGGVHPCAVCRSQLDQFLQSRPLPRSHAAQYGLREEEVASGARVCNSCRCKAVRSRYTQCPLPTCPNARGRVKRLRPLPGRWAELPPEVRAPIITEFQIPSTVTKCCSACFNRISRRLSPQEEGDCGNQRWTEEETEGLRRGLREFGLSWSKVAEQVGPTRSSQQCRNFYFNYRKKLGLDVLVQEYNKNHLGEERKPTVTDEEESGSSTSSCEEFVGPPINSDTDSATSPTVEEKVVTSATPSNDQPLKTKPKGPVTTAANSVSRSGEETNTQPPPAPCKEDYDSSATETADEGQGGAEGETGASTSRQSPAKGYIPPQPPVPTENGPTNGRESSSPSNSVRSVKDLMLGVIEMQLMRSHSGSGPNACAPPGTSVAPTISSILGGVDNHRQQQPDVTFVREFSNKQLATLSVVSSHQHLPPPAPTLLQHSQATVTLVELPKEGLVVSQVQQAMRESRSEPEGVTLDLSLKKHRECSPSPLTQSMSRGPSPISPYNLPPPPAHSAHNKHQLHHPSSQSYSRAGEQFYSHPVVVSTESRSVTKSPSVYVSTVPENRGPTPHLVMNQQPRPTAPTAKIPKVATLSSPKLPPAASTKGGSITHGTPVSASSQQQRYDSGGLLRQMTPPQQPPHKEGGSITQGTPVLHHLYPHDKRAGAVYEYYKRLSPSGNSNAGAGAYVPPPYQGGPPSSGFPYPRPAYPTEQQMSSRQIIMNDYITSQQMHGPPRRLPEKEYYQGGQYPSSRPPSAERPATGTPPPPQARQGVIQRHNAARPKPPSPQQQQRSYHHPHHPHYPPGHEALSSLVDVAVQQPSLPVPKEEKPEGLGKAVLEHEHRYRYDQPRHQREMQQLQIQQQQQQQQQQQLRQRIEQRHHQMTVAFREQQQQLEATRMLVGGFPRDAGTSPNPLPANRQPPQQSVPESTRARTPSGRVTETAAPTLTAASLIDAIITHQINQSSTDNGPSSGSAGQGPTRPGDRLFQGFHREQAPPPTAPPHESNGKASPLKPSAAHSPMPTQAQQSVPEQGGKAITLAEHIDSIITKDFSQAAQQRLFQQQDVIDSQQQPQQQQQQQQQQHSLKLRYALQQQEAAVAQVRDKEERQVIRVAAPKSPECWNRYYAEQKPSHLSPLDYVKNRIVEVMRTSEDEKGRDRESPGEMVIDEGKASTSSPPPPVSNASSFVPPPTTTYYPFSALNVMSPNPGQPPPSNKQSTPGSPVPESAPRTVEPAPLLSDQYEPLSDED